MNILVIILIVFGNVPSNFASEAIEKSPIGKYDHLNAIIEELQSLEWEYDEEPCLKQLVKIIRNVQNSTLWATWIWDSMQTPVGQLYGSRNNYGNYDECLEFPWEKIHPDLRTQYCLAHIRLADVDSEVKEVDLFGHVENYLRSKSINNLKFNTMTWGICAPVGCNAHSIAKLVGVLFRHTHLGLAVDNPDISFSECNISGKVDDSFNFGFYFVWSTIAFAIIFTLLCTAYVDYIGLDNKGLTFFKAFHIPRNIHALVKVYDEDIGSFFGIRVIACVSVAFFHIWVLLLNQGVINNLRLDKDFEKKWLTMFLQCEVSVDTFLFMSGFLLVKALARNGFKSFNPLKAIFKRYCRLILPLMLIVLLSFSGFQHTVDGPVRNDFYQKELETYSNRWYANLLMIQNYFRTAHLCYPISWSVACDFQLTIIGIMIAWVFARNRKFGSLIFLASFVASIVVPAVRAYTIVGSALIPGDYRLLSDYMDFMLGNPLYTPAQYRAGAYLVGMAVGYLMTIYNPVNHRNILTKNFSILSFCTLLMMGSEFFITSDSMIKHDNSALAVVMYISLKRIIWAVLIAILVIICEYGTLPVVPGILSWSAWVPVGRLSYGIYLIHIVLMMYYVNTTRVPLQYDLLNFVVYSLGVVTASTILSFIVWTFYEAPLANITSLLFRNRYKIHEIQSEKNPKESELKDLKKMQASQVNGGEKANKL